MRLASFALSLKRESLSKLSGEAIGSGIINLENEAAALREMWRS